MMDFHAIFESLETATGGEDHFSAEPITEFPNHRIGKDIKGNPVLLLFSIRDFSLPNSLDISLNNISVYFDINCTIQAKGITTIQNFSIIRFTASNPELRRRFLRLSEGVVKSLGNEPDSQSVSSEVAYFVELLKAAQSTPLKTILGLWAELLVIEQSEQPEQLLMAWHSLPEERYDFSFGEKRLEVKATLGRLREHYFSLEQLKPPAGTQLYVASVLTAISGGGVSINDLYDRIVSNASLSPDLKKRIDLLITKIAGNEISRALELRFDYQLGVDSLRFFRGESIPCIEETAIPAEIREIKFRVSLETAKSITIPKPYNLDSSDC